MIVNIDDVGDGFHIANMMTNTADLTATLWHALLTAGDPVTGAPLLERRGVPGGLPSVFAVDALSGATVSAAVASVAELFGARLGESPPPAMVDFGEVAAAFRSERLQEPVGWKLPEIWDPIAGDYRTRDGFIRIHTNYAHHRDAALRALQVPADRAAVTAAVAQRDGDELEAAIVAEGGAAAKMRSLAEWRVHPQGEAVAAEPLVATKTSACERPALFEGTLVRPLTGIRVLDLTRVIAGPVCTRLLAAYGAEVLRIDPPGFEEVGALMGETTAGKRRAFLDLRTKEGRDTFLRLVAEADVLVCGYRNSSLENMGLGPRILRSRNPSLVSVRLDAYGWSGPWADRRGFDSLVQMSSGIAHRATKDPDKPGALPAQALDHGAGYLLAATVCRALTRRITRGLATEAHLSLARIAALLIAQGDTGDASAPLVTSGDPWREREETAFGTLLRVRVPGTVGSYTPYFTRPAGPLGSDAPSFDGP